MSDIKGIASSFFEACETGKGWDVCKSYCLENASFSSHAEPLLEVTTIQGYADWMQGVCGLMPDCSYEIKALTVDEENQHVSFFAVFSGTHTGEGGPPPTGLHGIVDYVYVLEFSEDKIKHATKIWNPHYFFKQIGWE